MMRTLGVVSACSALFAVLALAGCEPEPSRYTDDPARRTEATTLARAYVEAHRADLLGESVVTLGAARVTGGRLRDVSVRAFEVSLALDGDAQVTEVVVYLYKGDGLVVAGAQTRDHYGAVRRTIGGRLDREFTSRD